ncbi:MAG TPA: methyltransferase domain-containing protein [Nocardioidaceae bacterium]|nr:methyltransferase domain-containing protein [Nocardioidaceae bacterium]
MPDHTWDPDRYLVYADERGRPFHDLLARVRAPDPRHVVDLGCGPGNLTALLSKRWPAAEVLGVDSSSAMVDRARAAAPGVRFEVGDLRHWSPGGPSSAGSGGVDVVVSNATLQWVPGHLGLLPTLVSHLASRGCLAFQVPGNFDAPSHVLLDDLSRDPRFAPYLGEVARPESHEPQVYADALLDLGLSVDAWETTYLHLLQGPDPVFTWVSGTGARPVLEALPDDLREELAAGYRAALREAYPAGRHGTVLPFRRVFLVATR